MRRWAIGFLSRAHLAAYRLSRGRAFGSEPRLTGSPDRRMPPTAVTTTGRDFTSPRRLSARSPREALLHHDGGVPLKSVDDDRVLDRIVHRDTREMGKGLPTAVEDRGREAGRALCPGRFS